MTRIRQGAPRILSLWAINAPLDKERLCRQLDDMRRDGLDGVVFHPRFYPGNPAFLSREYLRILSGVILHAREIGLLFWIYDENGWPSGVAGGELIRQYPEDVGGILTLHEGDAPGAWHAFSAQGKRWRLRFERTREIDYFNPASCGHFLQLVHDRYRDGLDPAAWAHVEAFFTDEPEFGLGVNIDKIPTHGGISWSPILADIYQQRFGRDVREDLPLIFFNDPRGDHEEVRIRFWEWMTDQLCDGFLAPYHAWCRREGKLFAGHFKGDEHPLFQVMMNGSCHQGFRHFDLPGIDPLERFPAFDYYAREVASVSRQVGTGRVMAEAMGGAGWGSSPEDFERFLLWLTNHGATDLAIHLHQYRLDSSAIRDWPPSTPGGLNWREAYPEVLNRVRRKTDCTDVANADTLVVAPYRGIMALYEPWSLVESNIHNCATYPDTPAGRLNTSFLSLVARLKNGRSRHHFVDERSMEEDGRVSEGRLFVGRHAYTKVILSEGCRPNASGSRLLREFQAAGGLVLTAGKVPPSVTEEDLASPMAITGAGNLALTWETASTPANDLFLEPIREASTDWWRAEYEVGSTVQAPLSLEFADDIAVAELDGRPLGLATTHEGSHARLPDGAGMPGRHEIRFQLKGKDAGPLFAWLQGYFHVLSRSDWTAGPNGTRCTAGPWRIEPMTPVAAGAERTENGWPFARSAVILQGKVNSSQNLPSGTRLSCLGAVADAAHVALDGLNCGWVWGPDWSLALSAPLDAGVHSVTMKLIPSTYNRFGPHHHIDGDRHVVSPGQFSGQKNFADHSGAPEFTHDALWRTKPLTPPTSLGLCRRASSADDL